MPHTTPKPSRIPGPLHKAGLFVLFAAITAALCLLLNFLLVDDLHAYSRVTLGEYYAQADAVDTVFVGSSHSYRSFDPDTIDPILGSHSFNLGTSQQQPDGSYWLIREAAANSPLKTVYLETFYTGYNQQKSSNVPLACYLITDYMRASSPYRYQYLWEMGGAAAFADLVFPARHAIADPGELPALWRGKLTGGYNAGNYDWVTYPDEGEAYRDRGFVYTEGTSIWGFGTLMHVDASAPISPFGRANLTRIAEFCKKQNIRLVLVTAPLPSAYVQDTQNYQAYVDAMRSFAAANGTQYWDFSLFKDTDLLPIGFDDFSDMHHLNGQGKGECCIEGDAGAPVELDEVEKLEEVLPVIWDELSPEARAVIDKQGVVYTDEEGDLVTSIVNHKDCVFTCYDEKGYCYCAIEKAFRAGKTDLYKPISCHLYPIRIGDYGPYKAVNYHRWNVCKAAVLLGQKENLPVYKFLKEPLVRKFGEEWYKELEIAAEELQRRGMM